MSLSIIVMGVGGRMGSTIAHLVQDSDDLELAAVVERAGKEKALEGYACLKGNELATLIGQCPGALIIDFTAPEVSLKNAELAAEFGNPLIIGTTGITAEQKGRISELAKKTPIFLSPNMSIGVNVLLNLLPELTRALGDSYDVEMVELHHNRKKDAPSGTALRMAEALAEGKNWNLDEVGCYHREGMVGERPHKEIGVQAIRGGDVVGVHTVYFMGPGERIELTHQAHSRENFAYGALRAARWLCGKPAGPLYSMQDVLAEASKN